MKREYFPVIIFLLFNSAFLITCFLFFWSPFYSTVKNEYKSLNLQERLLNEKEANLLGYGSNLSVLQDTRRELSEGEVVLIPYSEAADILAGITNKAVDLNLTETAFYMSEPAVYDTEENSVAILEISAAYSGEYEKLFDFMRFLTGNSVCSVETVSISKGDGESNLTAEFTLYALFE